MPNPNERQPIPLWPAEAAPSAADGPSLQYFPAAAPTGAAMIVCPGGGYGFLAPHEGEPVARWLNALGVNAFVLSYRLGPTHPHPAPMDDLQQAMRLVRAQAAGRGIDPRRVGVLGFSAGGHLAATVATLSDPDCRPNLAVLIYPVITMGAHTSHGGSRKNLLGDSPDPALVERLSLERQVTPQTPPCFLVTTADDALVPAQNSLMFATACIEQRVPIELHILPHGPHGFGLAENNPELHRWTTLAAHWLQRHNFAAEHSS